MSHATDRSSRQRCAPPRPKGVHGSPSPADEKPVPAPSFGFKAVPVSSTLATHASARTTLDQFTAQAVQPHQPGDAVVADHDALIDELGVDARGTVGGVAGAVDLADTLHQLGIGLCTHAGRAIAPVVVAAGGYAQHAAQASHGEVGLVRLHKFEDVVDVRSLLPANQAVASLDARHLTAVRPVHCAKHSLACGLRPRGSSCEWRWR